VFLCVGLCVHGMHVYVFVKPTEMEGDEAFTRNLAYLF